MSRLLIPIASFVGLAICMASLLGFSKDERGRELSRTEMTEIVGGTPADGPGYVCDDIYGCTLPPSGCYGPSCPDKEQSAGVNDEECVWTGNMLVACTQAVTSAECRETRDCEPDGSGGCRFVSGAGWLAMAPFGPVSCH